MIKGKKMVLFIVEGSSDQAALEGILKKIYKRQKDIGFKVTDGDITSNPTVTIQNVEKRIWENVKSFFDEKKLNKSDIIQLVQIFDMDGIYVPDNAIISGSTYAFRYSTTDISCTNPQRAIERNYIKREIMDYLRTLTEINRYPYEMYYMSCNLDHALYNEINLDKELKQKFADEFYEKFIGKEYMFPEFLKTDVSNGVPDSYPASWRYIKENLRSLERHTNLHIYFDRNPIPGGLL